MRALVAVSVLLLALCVAWCECVAVQDDCPTFNGENGCVGDQTNQDPNWENRRFQTPPRGNSHWKASYQDYSRVQGWTSVVYTADQRAATVTVQTVVHKDVTSAMLFVFGGGSPSPNPTYQAVAANDTKPLTVEIRTSVGGYSVILEEVNFVWNHQKIDRSETKGGQFGSLVEMFGWPYQDIASECSMLGKAGYMGVKVFPPSESILSDRWLQNGERNPWFWVYQPVSYRLASRMGSLEDLKAMIKECRSHGVRVYADAVNNHMTGGGNDVGLHRNGDGGGCVYWGPKDSSFGSPYFTQDFNYENNNFTHKHPALEYPAVPYGPLDFHCERPLNSWTSPFDLNYGWLVGLSDLNTERPNVQQRIADYWTQLLGMGFSGFRLDAAKHIQPDDLAQIFGRFRRNMGGTLPEDFVAYLEVIIGGEKDLLLCDKDNSYSFSAYFDRVLEKNGLSAEDIAKIKLWESAYPKEFPICGYWVIPSTRFAIENDCHDDQFPGSSSRDMGDKGSVLVKEKNVSLHRHFEELMYSRTDGDWRIKLLLSSYTFMDYGAYGFPDGFSDCLGCVGPDYGSCKSMPYSKAHEPDACGYTVYTASGEWAQGVYTRVHRDKSIILAMRAWQGLPTNVSNADIGLPSHCT